MYSEELIKHPKLQPLMKSFKKKFPKIDLRSNMMCLGWWGYQGMGLDVDKEHWREKVKLTSEVKSRIRTNLFYLPQQSYPDSEIEYRKDKIYQHVYSSYFGGGNSVYKQSA